MSDNDLIRRGDVAAACQHPCVSCRDAIAALPAAPTFTAADLTEAGKVADECFEAVSGEGPRAYDWTDKPHRLVYDMYGTIRSLIALATAQAARIEGMELKLVAAMRREENAWREANHARAKVRGWEATVVVRNLPKLSIPVTDWGPGQGEQTAIPHITPERLTDILDKLTAAEAALAALEARVAKLVETGNRMANSIKGDYIHPGAATAWDAALAAFNKPDP